MQNQDFYNDALVVKLVDTKDLKAEGFTDKSVRGSLCLLYTSDAADE